MAVAFDAQSHLALGTGDRNFAHITAAAPRGAIVVIVDGVTTDQVVGVTYGGAAMTEVALSPTILATGEGGTVHSFFKGTGLLSGTQTVAIDRGDATNYLASCFTVTAGGDTEVVDTKAVTNVSLANPSVTLANPAGRTIFVAGGLFNGAAAVTSITPGTGYANGQEGDNGAEVFGTSYLSATPLPTTDRIYDWVAVLDDVAMLAVAIAEVAGGGGGRLHRVSALTGLGGAGQVQRTPSLS